MNKWINVFISVQERKGWKNRHIATFLSLSDCVLQWHNIKLLLYRFQRWHIAAEIEDDFTPLQSLTVPSRQTPPSIASDCPATAPGGSLDMWVWQTERETECLQGQEWVWRESTQLLDGGSEVSSLQSKAAAARLWHAPWSCSLTGYDKRPSGSQKQTAPCPCVRRMKALVSSQSAPGHLSLTLLHYRRTRIR